MGYIRPRNSQTEFFFTTGNEEVSRKAELENGKRNFFKPLFASNIVPRNKIACQVLRNKVPGNQKEAN